MAARRRTTRYAQKGKDNPGGESRIAESYKHPESDQPMRPEVGTQAQFKKKKAPQAYRYDSSLAPALNWDGQNPAREQGEALVRQVLEAGTLEEAKAAAEKLRALGKPFLDWAGKAERLSFDVPTLPLFVHERLSTKAILETLKGHKRDKQMSIFDLFSDPQHSIADQVLRAYEHRDKWTNRMILGDSLVVMNSLLHYEGLGGQVQMIYMDPPYGVKFGSNFQPFVRKRDVVHNDDDDMTREPEMVQAYRDTWEMGLHSYLTYMRDRLLLWRELLAPSGSIFVQISDENLPEGLQAMSGYEVPEPIICSPFEEPQEHWNIIEREVPERVPGRRKALYFYRDPRASPAVQAGEGIGIAIELKLVNLIRERVATWRQGGYPGVSRTTLELLSWWRREGREQRLFFAQLEAAETIVFLTEARADFRQGIDIPRDEPGRTSGNKDSAVSYATHARWPPDPERPR